MSLIKYFFEVHLGLQKAFEKPICLRYLGTQLLLMEQPKMIKKYPRKLSKTYMLLSDKA